jgi:GntR family transcriptional regulator, trigonelline degradation regulator
VDDQAEMRIERVSKTLRELALEKMRSAILDFRFKPGDRLVERNIAQMLGVSRTVVREVIRNLESEGLVEIVPHHGPIVAKASPEDVEQIYELRMLLEGAAARSAALSARPEDVEALRHSLAEVQDGYRAGEPTKVLSATSKFYETLFICGGKPVALNMLKAINSRINHLRAVTISTEGRAQAGPAEMQNIVDAIARGDVEEAQAATTRHVTSAATLALAHLKL